MRAPDPATHIGSELKVIIKYGTHQVSTSITQFVSEVVSVLVGQWIDEKIGGIVAKAEYGSEGMVIPMGKK